MEGRAEGIAEGEAKASITVAKKMKAKGIENEVIAEVTGLDIETVSTL